MPSKTPTSDRDEEAVSLLEANQPAAGGSSNAGAADPMLRPGNSSGPGTSCSEEPCSHGTCRICLDDEQDSDNPLISPCRCTGSTRFVHRQCLMRWRSMKTGTQAYYRCEICHFEYKYRRLWWARILRHPATSGALFAVLLAGSAWLLGYLPLLEWLLGTQPGANPWLHLANGLLIVGLVGFTLMLCGVCAVPGPRAPLLCDTCYFATCPDMAAAGGAGEACAVVMVGVVVVMAVAGLAYVVTVMYGMLYSGVRSRLQWAERLVENVGAAGSAEGRGGAQGLWGWARGRGGRGGGARAGAAAAAGPGAGASTSSGAAGPSGSCCAAVTEAPEKECMV